MNEPPKDANVSSELAKEPTREAADRTLMAWVRTCLSLIGFGFGIAKFRDILVEAGLHRGSEHIHSTLIFGLSFIALGIFGLLAAVIQHWRILQHIKSGGFQYAGYRPLAMISASLSGRISDCFRINVFILDKEEKTMITDKLVPNIEKRMSAWSSIQERLSKEQPPKPRLAVTISREYGCEGYPLAETLKTLLEVKTGDLWTVFDKTLIERVSNDAALSERFLSNLGDASKPVDDIFGTLMPHWTTHTDAYRLLARQVIALARQGNAIIVGRGGAVLTQRLSNCFHFRLVAPLEYRIKSIHERLNIPFEEARTLVIEHQRAREKFLESFLNRSIADPYYYHCVFNSTKSTTPIIARSILNLIFEP